MKVKAVLLKVTQALLLLNGICIIGIGIIWMGTKELSTQTHWEFGLIAFSLGILSVLGSLAIYLTRDNPEEKMRW